MLMWLVFLFVSAEVGTFFMTLAHRMGAGVWAGRGMGCLAAVVAGLLFCYIAERIQNRRKTEI